MSTGDPHFPGNCWCGINHSESDWQAGYDAAKRETAGVTLDPRPDPDTALREAAQAVVDSDANHDGLLYVHIDVLRIALEAAR